MIRVLLFAELEEETGRREIEIDEDELQVGSIRSKLKDEFPGANGLNLAMPALNEEYAEENTLVHRDDLLAFIPPVSGG